MSQPLFEFVIFNNQIHSIWKLCNCFGFLDPGFQSSQRWQLLNKWKKSEFWWDLQFSGLRDSHKSVCEHQCMCCVLFVQCSRCQFMLNSAWIIAPPHTQIIWNYLKGKIYPLLCFTLHSRTRSQEKTRNLSFWLQHLNLNILCTFSEPNNNLCTRNGR